MNIVRLFLTCYVKGSALNFDGSNDIVIAPANSAFNFTTGTAECWFNTAASSGNDGALAMRSSFFNTRWSILEEKFVRGDIDNCLRNINRNLQLK